MGAQGCKPLRGFACAPAAGRRSGRRAGARHPPHGERRTREILGGALLDPRRHAGRPLGRAGPRLRGRHGALRRADRHRLRLPPEEGVEEVRLSQWTVDLEGFGNALEAAEKRRNARTGRSYVIALPHQLTADRRVALVDGCCEWLLERHGVASAACIHAPPCHAKRRTRMTGHGRGDPRNWHVHVIASTGRFDTGAQVFGEKARELDHIRDGPRELERQRAEWARRATEVLREAGETVVVDLRSHERRTAAGDAPPGLVPQRHAGSARTAISRAQEDRSGLAEGATFERHMTSERNDEPWHLWAELLDVERAIARDEEAMRRAATTDDRDEAKTKPEPRPTVISAVELCSTVSERRLPRRTRNARSDTTGCELRRPGGDRNGNLALEPLGPAAGTERRRTVEAMPASAADRRVDPRQPDARDDAERIAAAAAAMAP